MTFDILLRDWSHPGGSIQYGHVPWDSEIFGFPFYQLHFSDISQSLSGSLHDFLLFLEGESDGECFAFAKVPSHDIRLVQTLTENGFYPVETLVRLCRELRTFRANRRFKRLRLTLATVEDKPRLLDIARDAFSTDRYHLDPNLSKDRASYRYVYWLDGGMESGDPVFVYQDTRDGKSLGFCHLREVAEGVVDFSLAAIDSQYHGTGLGVTMYSECLAECQRRGYSQIVTRVSMNNIPVVNIYAHLGFVFRQPTVTLHWYYSRATRPC